MSGATFFLSDLKHFRKSFLPLQSFLLILANLVIGQHIKGVTFHCGKTFRLSETLNPHGTGLNVASLPSVGEMAKL